MDFLKDNIRTLFFRLLFPFIVSAVVMSIYSFVDTIAVGQSEGVLGTAAEDVLYGNVVLPAGHVVVCGGGEVGGETAEFIANA